MLTENHGGKVVIGGKVNVSEKYVEPTIIDGPKIDSKVMTEEIFGPILPIITYNNINETI